MSVSSFPRPEHIALLRRKIEERLRERGLPVEVTERGLNQMKCQYRFGFRRVNSSEQENSSPEDWTELAIHFQIAQRLEEGNEQELRRFLDRFVNTHLF